MISRRKVRRMAGLIHRYFSDAVLRTVADPRGERGRRWKSCIPLLKAILLGLAAGCKGLTEVEEMTASLSKSARKDVGIPHRIPDTTLRDFLCKLDPEQLCNLLYVLGYDGWRRKALVRLEDFPFHAVSMDGKYPSVPDTGIYEYLQVRHDADGHPIHGLIRTVTAALVTALGRPVLGAVPIPGATNEQGSFDKAFGDLVRIYGRLFRVVMYDAGAASLGNADTVIAAGKHYFFQVADPRWIMYQTMELMLANKAPDACDEELISAHKRIVREVTILPVANIGRKNPIIWRHAKTILKVYSKTYEGNECTGTNTRYFITSMQNTELSAEMWIKFIILRWGVETVHQVLDTAFEEDKRLWITADAQGALAVMLLRRVAYTVLTLFKSVTLRSEEHREMPWRHVMKWFADTLAWAQRETFEGLRPRRFATPPAFAS